MTPSRRTPFDPRMLAAAALLAVACAAPAAAQNFVTQWGSAGSGPGQFDGPQAIACAPNGHVYVVDTGNSRIEEFTSSGAFVRQFGVAGSGPGELGYCTGIDADAASNLYVADMTNQRVHKFSATGAFLTDIGVSGSGNGEFGYVSDVAVDALGRIYVSDIGNNRIQVFSPAGAYLAQWGGVAFGSDEAVGLAVDPFNHVYASLYWNHFLKRYAANGVFQLQWGSNGGGVFNGLSFNYPAGMDADADGTLYVAQPALVRKISASGVEIATWGGFGSAPGSFNHPHDVAADSQGNCYVADTNNHRIQKFGDQPVAARASTWGRVKTLFH